MAEQARAKEPDLGQFSYQMALDNARLQQAQYGAFLGNMTVSNTGTVATSYLANQLVGAR